MEINNLNEIKEKVTNGTLGYFGYVILNEIEDKDKDTLFKWLKDNYNNINDDTYIDKDKDMLVSCYNDFINDDYDEYITDKKIDSSGLSLDAYMKMFGSIRLKEYIQDMFDIQDDLHF